MILSLFSASDPHSLNNMLTTFTSNLSLCNSNAVTVIVKTMLLVVYPPFTFLSSS